jgi:hypothetical protein
VALRLDALLPYYQPPLYPTPSRPQRRTCTRIRALEDRDTSRRFFVGPDLETDTLLVMAHWT